MKYILMTGLLVGYIAIFGQSPKHLKTLVSTGGSVGGGYSISQVSAVGEFAVSSFNTGYYSGNIGYLDAVDTLVYSGLEDLGKTNMVFNVFPNPSSGDVQIEFRTDNSDKNYRLRLNNLMGELVSEYAIEEGYFTINKNLLPASGGVFLVNIIQNGRIVNVYKLVRF